MSSKILNDVIYIIENTFYEDNEDEDPLALDDDEESIIHKFVFQRFQFLRKLKTTIKFNMVIQIKHLHRLYFI